LLTTFAEQGFIGTALLSIAVALALFLGLSALRRAPQNLRGAFHAGLIGATVCLIGGLSQDMARQPICWALIGFLSAGSVFQRVTVIAENK
jgi:uncharacterized membrane protein